MKTSTMAIIVVAIVVVAGVCVGAYALTSNEDSDVAIESSLMIRGNADNNYTIDQNDMDIVEDVMNGEKSLEDYPLADVNDDGVVDSKDVSILQDMIDRKEGTTVYVQSLDIYGNEVTVPVTYPLRNVVTHTTNMDMPLVYSGGGQYLAGYFSMSYTNAQASISSTAVDLEGSSRTISDTAWANFTSLDSSLQSSGGIGALIVSYDGIAQITESRYSDLQAADIPLLVWAAADASVESKVVITLSYLFGTETESIGADYAELYDKVMSQIDDALSGYTDDEKTTFIAFTMYIYICQTDSTYNNTAKTAYGLHYSEVNEEFASTYAGTGSTKMQSVEALSNYSDVGALINNRSMDWQTSEEDVADIIVSTWEHSNSGVSSTEYFEGFEDRLVYVNNLLPGPAKLAYTVAALYGDLFSYEWAGEILQECIDMGLIPLQGYTVDELVPYFDYDLYQTYKS